MGEVTLTVTDGALGIAPQSIDGIAAKIGCCSSGTVGTVYAFSDIKTLVATLGQGPLIEAAAHSLTVAGGPVYCIRATSSTAGSAGAVTQSGTGPVVTVAGAANDAYSTKVLIVAGGALATGTFKVSLDNGASYGAIYTLPTGGTYLIPDTGLTLTFAAGSYVIAELYSFTSVAPMFDATALTAALTALSADPREWRLVHATGQAADASGTATLISAMDVALTLMATNFRYVRGFIEAADTTDALLIAALAAIAPLRVGLCVGFEILNSVISGRQYKRNCGLSVAARAVKVPVHEHLGRVATGSLPGITSLLRDERVTPGMDTQRCTTLRTYVGLTGCYITAGRTLAPVTSDYQLIQNGFVIDKACRSVRTSLLRFLNDSVRVNKTTGFILEKDAQKVEVYVKGLLNTALKLGPTGPSETSDASDTSVSVSRTENILSSSTLPVTVRVTPLGYMTQISVDIGLLNPALTLV